MIGFGVYVVVEVVCGNEERVIELGKGMGRVIGFVLFGGGFFRNVFVFYELVMVGDLLGDVIGGGDIEIVV